MPEDTIATGGTFSDTGQLDDIRLELDAIVESQRRMNAAFGASEQLGRQFAKTMTTAFTGLAIQGKSFGDVLASLALSLSNLALGAAFKPLGGAFSSALQTLISGPALFSSSGIAAPVDFTMSSGASVSGLGGGGFAATDPFGGIAASGLIGPTITFNVSTPDADSFARSETQIAALLARSVAQGQRNL